MKLFITLFTACFLFTGALSAQVVDDEPVEEPYKEYNERPYPATNIPVSPEVAGFMALFEDSEVGNLQVFSDFGEEIAADYFFTGQEIGTGHKELFTNEFRDLIEENSIYAAYSIKGNEEEHYIVRLPTNKGANTIWLFTIEGEVVKPLQQLAYAFCKNGACYQQDSWITDLDGDTDLDILVKSRQTDANTRKVKQKNEQVYLQNEAGGFRLVEKGLISFEPGKFNMKELEH